MLQLGEQVNRGIVIPHRLLGSVTLALRREQVHDWPKFLQLVLQARPFRLFA
jgi:hypothetical protein